MTIEQFKNNWQPQMDSYAKFSFNLDLKELVQQIRTDAETEHKAMCESCIHKVSADDIEAIRNSAIDEYSNKLWQVIEKATVNCKFDFTIDDLHNLEIVIKGLAEEMKESKE